MIPFPGITYGIYIWINRNSYLGYNESLSLWEINKYHPKILFFFTAIPGDICDIYYLSKIKIIEVGYSQTVNEEKYKKEKKYLENWSKISIFNDKI